MGYRGYHPQEGVTLSTIWVEQVTVATRSPESDLEGLSRQVNRRQTTGCPVDGLNTLLHSSPTILPPGLLLLLPNLLKTSLSLSPQTSRTTVSKGDIPLRRERR